MELKILLFRSCKNIIICSSNMETESLVNISNHTWQWTNVFSTIPFNLYAYPKPGSCAESHWPLWCSNENKDITWEQAKANSSTIRFVYFQSLLTRSDGVIFFYRIIQENFNEFPIYISANADYYQWLTIERKYAKTFFIWNYEWRSSWR